MKLTDTTQDSEGHPNGNLWSETMLQEVFLRLTIQQVVELKIRSMVDPDFFSQRARFIGHLESCIGESSDLPENAYYAIYVGLFDFLKEFNEFYQEDKQTNLARYEECIARFNSNL